MRGRNITIQRMVGVIFMLTGVTMLPPVLVGWYFQDGAARGFLESALLTMALGAALWYPVRGHRSDLRVRDGFLIVVIAWFTLGIGGAIPLWLADEPGMSFTDAVFESVSGLTTTGATVLTGLDDLPHAFLFYRQQLQWIGGMGIIVLAVAILPMLRIGGMQLFKAETPGPVKDSKLTPRITETAKALWGVYVGLTLLCTLFYWLAGMSLFDAVSHAFSTLALGGFSTHDASMAWFNNPLIEMIAIVFMVISGINFSIHYLAWRGVTGKPYLYDTEARVFVLVLVVVTLITALTLYFSGYSGFVDSLRKAGFHVVSVMTTAGFATDTFAYWPSMLPLLLLMLGFVGGCSGSTAGGMKMIRVILVVKQGMREVLQLIHPNAQIPIKLGGRTVSDRVINAVWGFYGLYIAMFCLFSLLVMATGVDLVTAVSAVATCINNLGPGLGEVASTMQGMNDAAKWMLSLVMIMGRLEVFTLVVLFTGDFWRN